MASFTRASGTIPCLDSRPASAQHPRADPDPDTGADPERAPEPVVVALVPVDLGPVPWATCLALDAAGRTVGVLELDAEESTRFRARVPRTRASAP